MSMAVRRGEVVAQQDYGFGPRAVGPWFDRRRIDVREPGEIGFWAKFFGVEEIAILMAVDKVGTEARRVRKYLQDSPPLH
jgi:uncharacterized protein DUF3606